MAEPQVVIVSPHFPPSNLAGVHRARHLAKHLPAHGWDPVVLTVDPAYYQETNDHRLMDLVPDNVRIARVPALPVRLTRAAGIGDVGLRAWRQLRAKLLQLVEEPRTKAVLITGSPFYPMLLAGAVKRRRAVAVVLDFQDPWVSAWGAAQPRFSKAGVSHALATVLEPKAVRHADFITSVSDRQNEEMRGRYPDLRPEQMAGIPIGGDPEDFELIRRSAGQDSILPADRINFSYVGTCLPRMDMTLRTLFRGYRRLRDEKPRLAERISLNFIGTSNQPDDFTTYRVRPIAEEEKVGEAVNEVPQRVAYASALAALAQSDAVLLLGSDEPHYTASKIYAGLMSGKAFLSLFHCASSAHEILGQAGGGLTMCFGSPVELEALEGAVSDAIELLADKSANLGRRDASAYEDVTARAVAGRYAAILDELALRAP